MPNYISPEQNPDCQCLLGDELTTTLCETGHIIECHHRRKEKDQVKQATINTDGACLGNPGPGGFGAIIEIDGLEDLIVTGGDPETTNNRMELSAVIEAMRALNAMPDIDWFRVAVRSDSQYVVNAFNRGWIKNWQRNGWLNAEKKPVANQDLWELMLRETARHTMAFKWVKGHAGDPMNERCDQLATTAAAYAPRADSYWCSDAIPSSVAEGAYLQANPSPAPPAGNTPQGTEALRILEAMSVLLEQCQTFEEFRTRMLQLMHDANW